MKYTVTYAHDGGKWWIAEVVGVAGCHTQGKSIDQARTRIREALSLYVGEEEADAAELVEDIRVTGPAADVIAEYRAAQEAEAEASKRREAAIRSIAAAFSVRDAAKLLGLSFQRVAQVAGKADHSDGSTVVAAKAARSLSRKGRASA